MFCLPSSAPPHLGAQAVKSQGVPVGTTSLGGLLGPRQRASAAVFSLCSITSTLILVIRGKFGRQELAMAFPLRISLSLRQGVYIWNNFHFVSKTLSLRFNLSVSPPFLRCEFNARSS